MIVSDAQNITDNPLFNPRIDIWMVPTLHKIKTTFSQLGFSMNELSVLKSKHVHSEMEKDKPLAYF